MEELLAIEPWEKKKQEGDWNDFVSEINTMTDPSFNEFTGKVFQGLTDEELIEQVSELAVKAEDCVYLHLRNKNDVKILKDRLDYLQQVAQQRMGTTISHVVSESVVQELVQMGFAPDIARQMLAITNGDMQQALNLLLEGAI
jgi:hypothetical protein